MATYRVVAYAPMHAGRRHQSERPIGGGPYVSEGLSWTQLEPGKSEVSEFSLPAEPLTLWRRRYNLGFKLAADMKPKTSVIAVAEDCRTRARFFGMEFDAGSIAAARTRMELSTEGPASFYSVSVDEEALARQYASTPDAVALLENARAIAIAGHPLHAGAFRAFMCRAFSMLAREEPGVLSRDRQGTLVASLVPLLAMVTDPMNKGAIKPTRCFSRRLAAVQTCEEFMREHIGDSVTLLDLSKASGLRARSLINAFEAVTGVSPMAYLKRLRLNGVRRALQRSDKRRIKIIDVATEWGFCHMGHFTGDYRRMFGQTPSQTLSN
jgi:AraC family transcriptional regulator, ethanolamine operon transcriptional activator